MEFCAKGSMRSWVGGERSARDVATLIRHAALGLVELHQQGGFHRDVKPDNILLSINADGRVSAKVGDFGIARMPTRSTTLMTWSAMGTKGYIAPELFAGQPVSWASDVYSLGITLREVLTGTTEVLSPRALRVPFELTSVIARMTHVAAGFRPSMAEVAVELHRFICGWALPAAPPVSLPVAAPAPPRPLAPMARAAVAPAAGGALAVAGLAALGLWFFGSDAKWDSSVGQYRGPDGRFT